MPKKSARGPFYYYMLDYKEEQRKIGVNFANMEELCEAAGPSWQQLRPSARAEYEQMAKQAKSGGSVEKYTSLGEPLSAVARREREKREAEEREQKDIGNIVKCKGFNESILDEQFYVIDVNYYCRILNTNKFVICELAMLRFTIRDGLLDEYHNMINPGELPQGYTSDAKIACEELGVEMPDPECPTDYNMILADIHQYLMAGVKNTEGRVVLPRMFTLPEKVAAVQSFISQLCDLSGENENIFRVYKIDTLYFNLANVMCEGKDEVGLPKQSLALVQIAKDQFQYHTDLGCTHHEQGEKFTQCAASRIKRWTYTILDHCCALRGIRMFAGKHLPNDVDVERSAAAKEGQSERCAASIAGWSLRSDAESDYGRNSEMSLATTVVRRGNRGLKMPPPVADEFAGAASPVKAKPPPRVMEEKPAASGRAWGSLPKLEAPNRVIGVQPPVLSDEDYPALGLGRGRHSDGGRGHRAHHPVLPAVGAHGLPLAFHQGQLESQAGIATAVGDIVFITRCYLQSALMDLRLLSIRQVEVTCRVKIKIVTVTLDGMVDADC